MQHSTTGGGGEYIGSYFEMPQMMNDMNTNMESDTSFSSYPPTPDVEINLSSNCYEVTQGDYLRIGSDQMYNQQRGYMNQMQQFDPSWHSYHQAPAQAQAAMYNQHHQHQQALAHGPSAGQLGRRGAISEARAHEQQAGSRQILSDGSPSPSNLPGGTYSNIMTTAVHHLQTTNGLRNDSFVNSTQPVHNFRDFTHQSNVVVAPTHPSRMTSGAQYPQTSSPGGALSSPVTDAHAGKIAIPALDRNNSSTNTNTGGPTSGSWSVKPRPKPGRKPMVDDPTSKRKLQNRHAQRAFRDRRAQKVADLEVELEQLNANHALEKASWSEAFEQVERESLKKDQQIAQLKAQVNGLLKWEKEAARLQIALDAAKNLQVGSQANNSSSHARPTTYFPQPSALTPPEDNDHDDMEIDFTAIYARRQTQYNMSAESPIGTDDHCGFCTEAENCVCLQQKQQMKNLAPLDPTRASNPVNTTQNASTPNFLEAPTKASGPGTCDMCLADPEKARQCKELAQSAHYTETTTSRPTAPLPGPSVLESRESRMTCSDFFTSARAKNLQLGPEHYRRIAHIYPYRRADGQLEHSPAMELDAQDAAHALAALSRQDTSERRN